MSIVLSQTIMAGRTVPGLVVHFAAGAGLGVIYFNAVWWNARLFARSGLGAAAIALVLGRFAVLGGSLALASFEGAAPLLAMALGVLVVRPLVMRKHRMAPS